MGSTAFRVYKNWMEKKIVDVKKKKKSTLYKHWFEPFRDSCFCSGDGRETVFPRSHGILDVGMVLSFCDEKRKTLIKRLKETIIVFYVFGRNAEKKEFFVFRMYFFVNVNLRRKSWKYSRGKGNLQFIFFFLKTYSGMWCSSTL